jgi:hypothetical protein
VRGARIVLTDDRGVRADMTASWLAQMGWEVLVLEGGYDGKLEIGPPLVIPKPDPSHRYRRYREDARTAMGDIFRNELPIQKRLERIYAVALDIYLSGESGPRGCFTVMTAASEAVHDPDIRAMVLEGFAELDKAFAACFRRAKEKGELPDSADATVLAQLASATIHTIAIRARAQMPRKELEAIVNGAIDVMLGA